MRPGGAAPGGLPATLLRRRDEARLALMLLTRLPMGRIAAPPSLAQAAWAYPLAGLVVGALAGGALAAARGLGLPAMAAAVLAVAVGALATGGMHEDGLADLADGFGGGATPARKLEIMRDSRIGAYGAMALVLGLMLRAALVAALPGGWPAVALLAGTGALSRAGLPLAMLALPPARADGLGSTAAAALAPGPAAVAALLGLALALMLLPAGLAAAGLVALVTLALGVLARRQIGGVTGDVLGAMQVMGELAVLCLLAAR